MAKRASKYHYLYVLQGNYGYGHGYEDLTAEVDSPEGKKMIKENLRLYRANDPRGVYRVIRRRERKPEHTHSR